MVVQTDFNDLIPFYASILRCPRCHGSFTDSGCTCGTLTTLPISGTNLLVEPLSPIKQKIQDFWSDICRQWYDQNDRTLTPAELDRQLDAVECYFRHRRQLATVEMPLHDLAGKTVLDVGSGSGAHTALFKRYGAKIAAVDISQERTRSTALKLALVEEGEGVAFQADAENLPFVDNSFDIIYSNGVLHHCGSTERAIEELWRVLKPSGRAVIMLHSRHSTQYWLNMVPKAILKGSFFRMPEDRWAGPITEGKPRYGTTPNPITRVYSGREVRQLMWAFNDLSMRKNSFRLDYFLFPRAGRIRNHLLRIFGKPYSPASKILYGYPVVEDVWIELVLSPYVGWIWNITGTKKQTSYTGD